MIKCTLEVEDEVEALYKIFLSENLNSKKARCSISKNTTLKFTITSKDPVGIKALINSILKIIQTYNKVK